MSENNEIVAQRYKAQIKNLTNDLVEVTILYNGLFGPRVRTILIDKEGFADYMTKKGTPITILLKPKTAQDIGDSKKAKEALMDIIDTVYLELQRMKDEANPDGFSNAFMMMEKHSVRQQYTMVSVNAAEELEEVVIIRKDFLFDAIRKLLHRKKAEERGK